MNPSPGPLLWGLGALVLLSLVAGIVVYRRSSLRPVDRWAAACLPTALALVAVACVSHLTLLPIRFWNGPRTVNPVVIAHGHGVYPGVHEGPLRTALYGPVKEILYVPAALGDRPSTAIWIAGCMSQAMALGPVLLFLLLDRRRRREAGRPAPWTVHAAAFVFVSAAFLLAYSTKYIVTQVHVDAPAVGFALLSCALLATGTGPAGRPSGRRLALAAIFAALSAWTKQIDVFLFAGQAPWLALVFGLRTAGLYLAWHLAFAVGLGILFVAWIGFETLAFHMVQLPLDLPPMGTPYWRWISSLELVVASSFGLLLVLLAIRAWRRSRAGDPWRAFLAARPWTILVFVALVLSPFAVLGRTVQGGDVNSYHPVYFLLVAAALILARGEFVSTARPANSDAAGRRSPRLVLYALAFLAPLLTLRQVQWETLDDPWNNPQEAAYEFALAHPRSAYFPWEQLSTYLATGRLDHYDYAIADLEYAGHPLDQERFLAHVPPEVRRVFYRDVSYRAMALSRLPGEWHRTTLAEMPGWIVWEKVDDDTAADSAAQASDPPAEL